MSETSIVLVTRFWRTRRRLSRWLDGLSLASLVSMAIVPPLVYLFARDVVSGALWTAAALVTSFASGFGAAVLSAGEAPENGEVRAHRGAVEVRRGKRVRRYAPGDIASGCVVPEHPILHVELRMRSGEVLKIAVRDRDQGDRLLEAAGVSATRQTLRMRLEQPGALFGTSRWLGLLAGMMMLVATIDVARDGDPGALPLVGLGALIALLVAQWRARWNELVVGADGITVRAKRLFVALAEIARVEERGDETVLHLHAGGEVMLGTAVLAPWDRGTVRHRIATAIAAGAGGERDTEAAALASLDRRGRSIAEWKAALAALLTRPAETFREPARVSRDAVERVLVDPALPGERRLAAALALSAVDRAAAIPHIRVAVDSCANEPVRAALEKLAVDEPDEIDDEVLEAASLERRAG